MPRGLKISVVIPVFDPGSDLDDCLRSLLDQSLRRRDYELILVDDGSTDGTPARLDALAAAEPNVRVEHIPNSGWPGRPRNVGADLARGEYIYFVDNDDWISRDALERLHARACRDQADIVVGKVVGHGKRVPRAVFERDRRQVGLEWTGLLGLLTPHKLFRRAFLQQHEIRFPEGRRRLEDHAFVMRAFLADPVVSVLADRPCYHWVQRTHEENASMRPFDPAGYYRNVREVLDIVVGHTEPGPFRDDLLAHWYRGKMLARVGSRNFTRRDPAYRRALYDEIRGLAVERYGPWVEGHLDFNLRVRSHLLRADAFPALEALAERESGLRARATLTESRVEGRDLVLRLDGRLRGPDGPLTFRPDGKRMLWQAPHGVAAALGPEQLDATRDLGDGLAQVFLRSTAEPVEYLLPSRAHVRLVPVRGTDTVKAVVDVETRIAAHQAAAGSRLPAGTWELLATIMIGGFQGTARIRRHGDPRPLTLTRTPLGRLRGPR